MTVSTSISTPAQAAKAQAIILPYYTTTKTWKDQSKTLDQQLDQKFTHLLKEKVLTGKASELTVVHTFNGVKAAYVILIGLGDPQKASSEILRKAAGTVARKLQSLHVKTAVWDITDSPLSAEETAQAIAEGAAMGSYSFDTFKSKTEKTPDPVELFIQAEKSSKSLTEAAQIGTLIGNAVNTARNLANTPANHLTPNDVIAWAKTQFKNDKSVTLEIIDAKKAKSLGMNLFLGVAQGSVEPPYMLVLRYTPTQGEKPVALVGKGVTFDSGGISIKPATKMGDMKGDMSGAAAVLATMTTVSQLKLKKNIIAVVALTENMPSGTAYRPSDVLTGMNGKTVEITNTDAEGRLVLADALCYVVKEGVKEIVDLATLTGACSVALGDVASAILGNNEALIQKWLKISETSGERLWQLPLYDEYFDYLKSDTADMVNASEGRLAGTCTGAKFLEQFVADTPWVHLDIASMMNYSSTSGYTVKGMSGVGVRNLITYLTQK